MNDLVIRNCLDFNQKKIDIFIRNGKIAEISERILISDIPEIDAGGHYNSPHNIQRKYKKEPTLSYGFPRINHTLT